MLYKLELITQNGNKFNEYLNGKLQEIINDILNDEEYSDVEQVSIYSVDEVPKDGEEEKNKKFIRSFGIYKEPKKEINITHKEFQYILNFVKDEIINISYYILGVKNEDDYDKHIIFRQLRSLWTSYCMHEDLVPDTLQYDVKFSEIYKEIQKEIPTIPFESFDLFMGGNLA